MNESRVGSVFSAASLMMLEKLRAKFPAPKLIMGCCAIGMVISLPVTLLTENRVFPISVSGWLSVIALALVCQVIGQVLQAYSLKALSSGLVGGFLLLERVLSTLMAWKFFAESLSLFHWFTFAVILLGIYLLQSSSYADRLIAEKTRSVKNNCRIIVGWVERSETQQAYTRWVSLPQPNLHKPIA